MTIHPWFVEDRVSLAPVLGKLVMHSLHRPDIKELLIPFGAHPQQKALLLWPSQAAARRRTLIYFIHGGGWSSGGPQLFRFIGHFFVELGFPTLLGGYRLAPEYRHPAQVEDCQAGWVAGLNALARRGIAVNRLILGGQSAGAQLAALLAFDRSRWQAKGLARGGYFSISGPISFDECVQPDLSRMIAGYIGSDDRQDWEAANPIRFLRSDETMPVLLIHGDSDPLVDAANVIAFARQLVLSPACPVELDLVPGGHHADLASIFVSDLPARKKFENWLLTWDQPGGGTPAASI